MKLKYLFSAIIASVLLLVGCEQEPIGTFEDIKLSSTNVSIPAEGGEVSVTLTTTIDWAFVTTDLWPNVIVYKTVDDKKVIDEEETKPSWLKLDGPMEGTAGEYTLKFSAEAVSGGRDLTLEIKAGSHSQYITIRQGTKAVENATCADVIAGVDGKVYRITGVCTKIANDLYGNWYLNDGTGEVYVYGTLDKDGATKNFASWKMAVGDIVTVEGPRKDYNGTIELVDVTVLNIEKSLLKIEEKPEAIAKEGGEYQLKLSYKGSGVQPSVPAVDEDGNSVDYREWISVVAVETKFGEATKLEPNPADTAFVTIRIQPNDGATRDGRIDFTSGTDEASSTVSFEFTQEGAIEEVTIADAIASGELCSVLGKVIFTHSKGVLITDGRDVLYGYLGAAPEVAVDDVVKMVGAVTKYNGGRSMNKPVVAKAEGTVGTYRTPAPVVLDAEKFAAYTSADADFATPYVMITGVAETDSYGNLIVKLVDGETTYSVKSYYGNDSFADWADKEVKAYGYAYNAYADSKQVNLIAVTVLDADAEEPTGPEISTIASVLALGQNAVIPDGTTVEGVVISNAALSNLTSKKGMYLQDESGAVQLRFTNDHTFAFGDKLQLDLSGVTVSAYNQAVQLSVDNTKAVFISADNTVTPKTVTMTDFLDNKYEGQYVALEGVQVAEVDLAKTWIMPGSNNEAAHTSINMEDAEGNTFVVFSSKYSTFGGTTVAQGSGTIKGISAKNNTTIQLIFAQESDFAGLTGARFGQEGGEEPTEKAARNLAFSSATATATLGEAFTAPTLSGEATGVLYTSSNTEVATVDAATGAVTLVAAGETTITAAAEETETLQAGSASYVLTVSAAAVEPVGPLTVTVAEFLAAEVSDTQEYQLTGVMSGTYNTTYGNFYLEDATAKVLVYGLTATKQTSNDKSFATLGLRDGDTVTLIGKRAVYVNPSTQAETHQVGGPAYYVSHVAAPYMELPAASVSVAAETTTYTIEVQSNVSWTATATEGVTLSPASGNGNASVVMTFAANTGETALTYTVTFTAGDLTKTFTLTHKAPANGGQSTDPVTLSIKIEDLVKENNYTVSAGQTVTNYKNLSLDSVISMVAGGSANNEGSFWDSGRQWRIYQTGGGKVTVSAIDGYTIQSVKFTYTVSNTGILKTTSGNLESGTVDTVNSSSVTYTVGNTGSATNGQVRITDVEVVYQAN